MKIKQTLFIVIVLAAALTFAAMVSASHYGDWSAPVSMESIPGTSSEFNTEFNDGCPYQSPDGLSFQAQWFAQTKEPKLPSEAVKLIRLNSLRISKVKRIKGGFLKAIFTPIGVQEASIDVTCKSGKEFSLSTGNNDGNCQVVFDSNNNSITGANCADNSGNTAKVDCNKGEGGSCTATSGSGDCR